MEDFSIKKLIFQDKDVEIISQKIYEEGERKILIIVARSNTITSPQICHRCGSIANFERKGLYTRTIKEMKIFDLEVIIKYKQVRLRCLECKKGINEILEFVKPASRLTNNLENEIVSRKEKGISMIQISDNIGTSITTVTNKLEKKDQIKRLPLSEVLCFDEFKGPAEFGKYPFIIVNPYTSEIIDIIGCRQQNYLFNYFENIDLSERENVKYIVTDLTGTYMMPIKRCFPNAKHIADRFHWLSLVTKSIQDIRISAMNFHKRVAYKIAQQYAKEEKSIERAAKSNEHYKIYYALKMNYKILNYNTYDNEYFNYLEGPAKLYKENKKYTRQQILEYILNNDSDLAEAYTLLQELYDIAFTSTEMNARKRINGWVKKVKSSDKHISALKDAALTIGSWIIPITNSFHIDETKLGLLSNGPCEAKNNTVKSIIKAGYGYKDFNLLRRIVLMDDRERTRRKEKEKNKKYNNFIRKNL